MKVVTAVAAIDSGRYTPESIVSGKSPKIIGGVPLSNCTEGSGATVRMTLTEALDEVRQHRLRRGRREAREQHMFEYMNRFGFDKKPPIDCPSRRADRRAACSARADGCSAPSDDVDIGRVAIGQERLEVTPLQMAMVAATVANGGKLMKPQLVDKIVVARRARARHGRSRPRSTR